MMMMMLMIIIIIVVRGLRQGYTRLTRVTSQYVQNNDRGEEGTTFGNALGCEWMR